MVEEWKFISEYPIKEYKCGLKAGDKIKIRKDIIVRDYKGNPTGKIYPQGEIWSVLPGAKEKEIVVWLLQADGERHTWNDDNTIYENFEVVEKL
jgi:hypothetical protein